MACLSTEEPRLDLDLQCHNVLVVGGRVVIEFQFEESFALTSLGDDLIMLRFSVSSTIPARLSDSLLVSLNTFDVKNLFSPTFFVEKSL